VELYSKDHVWLRQEGAVARVGISAFAQEELGEVAFVDLPAAGRRVVAGEAVCVVDSLKSTSEIYAPVSGTILDCNATLLEERQALLVNQDPLGRGWLFTMEIADPSELQLLMSEEQYLEYVGRGRAPEGSSADRPSR
jgi:glycine cleavage system H protein